VTAAGRVLGGCYCGDVRFEAELPPKFVAHCHCANCRRAHGAAFVTWIGFLAAQFRVTAGALSRFVTDTGATRSFCPRCGTTLLFEGPRWEGEVHVAFANLDEPGELAPDCHAYADRATDWCPILDELPRYGGANGNEPLE
jgi:hypothetical protein